MNTLNNLSWPQLYLLTNHDHSSHDQLTEDIRTALEHGVKIIQYRDKSKDTRKRLQQARLLRELTTDHEAMLIINDDIQLAGESSADGVHLGKDDGLILNARHQLGDNAVIGFSCYNQIERARYAAEHGASYIAFGRFFNSTTKPEAPQASIELVKQAQQELNLPIVAIGGITPDNAASLLTAGVNMIAVIDAVFGQQNIGSAIQRFTDRINHR